MILQEFFNNPKVVVSIGALGFAQTGIDFAMPFIQFLIAVATLIYMIFKIINEKNKTP